MLLLPRQLSWHHQQVIKEQFENEAATRGVQRLLVTSAVAAGKSTVDAGYEVSKICESVNLLLTKTIYFVNCLINVK